MNRNESQRVQYERVRKEINNRIFESPGWKLAWNSEEQRRLADQILSIPSIGIIDKDQGYKVSYTNSEDGIDGVLRQGFKKIIPGE